MALGVQFSAALMTLIQAWSEHHAMVSPKQQGHRKRSALRSQCETSISSWPFHPPMLRTTWHFILPMGAPETPSSGTEPSSPWPSIDAGHTGIPSVPGPLSFAPAARHTQTHSLVSRWQEMAQLRS